jgi:hypothetical protein
MFAGYAQTADTCFTKTQIRNIYNNIRILEFRDSMHQEIISKYKDQVTDYETLKYSDSITISGQSLQIKNLEKNNEDLNTINKLVKPKWYQLQVFVSITTFITTVTILSILK